MLLVNGSYVTFSEMCHSEHFNLKQKVEGEITD